MELFFTEVLKNAGIFSVLVVFLYLAWKKLDEKDKILLEVTEKMAVRYQENTNTLNKLIDILNENNKILIGLKNDLNNLNSEIINQNKKI